MNQEQTIEIPKSEYDDLLRSGETLAWLQRQGVCWRGADSLVDGWVIGNETEWHYSSFGNDIRDLVDKHKSLLANRWCNPMDEQLSPLQLDYTTGIDAEGRSHRRDDRLRGRSVRERGGKIGIRQVLCLPSLFPIRLNYQTSEKQYRQKDFHFQRTEYPNSALPSTSKK